MRYNPLTLFMPKHAEQRHKMPGFTLFEIIAVLVILSLLTVTAFIVMDDTDYNLLSQAQAVRQDIRYAHSMAMKTGTVWGVRSDGNAYWAFEGTVGTMRNFPGRDVPIQLIDLDVSLMPFTIYFNDSGQPINALGNTVANYTEIKVGSSDGDFLGGNLPTQTVTFRILPDTGFIEVVQ